ncbi:MAG: hypothetical protein C4292_04380 [Nitrososphaera sp.]
MVSSAIFCSSALFAALKLSTARAAIGTIDITIKSATSLPFRLWVRGFLTCVLPSPAATPWRKFLARALPIYY